MARIMGLCLLVGLSAIGARAQELSALARVDAAASYLRDDGAGIVLRLDLSQPVPYRLRLLADPPRLVADFREIDWAGVDAPALASGDRVVAVQTGPVRPGWSRMVVQMSGPFDIQSAVMRRDDVTGRAVLNLALAPVSMAEFATRVSTPESVLWGLPKAQDLPPPRKRQDGSRPLRVVLDPGHGGIDPGAERDQVREADLMLTFALELQEVLLRAGHEVALTRSDDSFVPLEARISIARAARADVFISLHADIVPEGNASGATIYTLSDSASDEASQKLAERHDRADLLAGVDLKDKDDVVANVLMELARRETAPRADQLADALVEGLRARIGRLHKRPRLTAGFSVLKAPDIPSVLVELGFLSSARDLANLTDPDWRARAAQGIAQGLQAWAISDAAQAGLLRQ